jgi:hypothetical protein
VKNVDRMPTFDIRTCFHRFLIQGSDRSKTTFAHPFTGVQYQLCHCSFGLTSTNNVVQCVLTNLLADLPYIALYMMIYVSSAPVI